MTASIKDRSEIAVFTVPGEPVSKERARVVQSEDGKRRKAYTPAKTAAAETTVAWRFRQQAGPYQPDPDAFYGVTAVFCSATNYRRDIDNMLKLVLDALNGVAWADDHQVVEIAARKVSCSAGEARTEVTVYRVDR